MPTKLKTLQNIDHQLTSFEQEWRRVKNPVHVWAAIDICIANNAAFPDWVLNYLARAAKKMKEDGEKRSLDLRSALPAIFQFINCRGGRSPLTALSDLRKVEKFAMAFAARIFEGDSPTEARANAAELADDQDERTLQRHLKKFFAVRDATKAEMASNKWWRRTLRLWFNAYPDVFRYYQVQHPSLLRAFTP
jgi:hypothetical protein